MTLGERIKQLRTEAELTQPELAVNAGIEQSYLSKLENDKAAPSFDVIAKVASALGLTGMTLINSLNPQYVQDKLSYMPEVAAQFAEHQLKEKQWTMRRYIMASLLIMFGIGLVLTGGSKALFPEVAYNYQSPGVVKLGEPLEIFTRHLMMGESRTERDTRLKSLTPRLNESFVTTYFYRGDNYVENVTEGRRLFNLVNKTEVEQPFNDWLMILGMMLITAGGFIFSYKNPFKTK